MILTTGKSLSCLSAKGLDREGRGVLSIFSAEKECLLLNTCVLVDLSHWVQDPVIPVSIICPPALSALSQSQGLFPLDFHWCFHWAATASLRVMESQDA